MLAIGGHVVDAAERMPVFAWAILVSALMIARTRLERQRMLRACALGALACAAGAWGISLAGHRGAGLLPGADGWSAAVGIIVADQGFHCVLLLVLGGFLLARSWCGRLVPRARATLDNVALLWQAAAVQGIALLRAVPALMD